MEIYNRLTEWSAEKDIRTVTERRFWEYLKGLPEKLNEDDLAEDTIEIFSMVDKAKFLLDEVKLSYEIALGDGLESAGFFTYSLDLVYAEMRIGSFTAVYDEDANSLEDFLQLEEPKLIKKFCRSVS